MLIVQSISNKEVIICELAVLVIMLFSTHDACASGSTVYNESRFGCVFASSLRLAVQGEEMSAAGKRHTEKVGIMYSLTAMSTIL